MRLKKEITAAQTRINHAVAPDNKEITEWENAVRDVREVLFANLDAYGASLDWDRYEAQWYFQIEVTASANHVSTTEDVPSAVTVRRWAAWPLYTPIETMIADATVAVEKATTAAYRAAAMIAGLES